MKSFYATVLLGSLLFFAMNSLITYATSPEEAIASQLARFPDRWELTFKDTHLDTETPAKSKERLIRFMRNAPRKSYEVPKDAALVLIVSAIFSSIGLAAEVMRARRTQTLS